MKSSVFLSKYMYKFYRLIVAHKKILALITVIFDLFYFTHTDPRTSVFVVALFGYMLSLLSIYIVCSLALRTLMALGVVESVHQWIPEAVSFLFFVFLVMESVGQLTLTDVIVFIFISVIGYFYYTRISSNQSL